MQRFVREFSVTTAYLPDVFRSDFNTLVKDIDPVVQGSLKATLQPLHLTTPLHDLKIWTQPESVVLPRSYLLSAFDQACISGIVYFPLS